MRFTDDVSSSSTNCAIDSFPPQPNLVLFKNRIAKWGIQLSNGLSSVDSHNHLSAWVNLRFLKYLRTWFILVFQCCICITQENAIKRNPWWFCSFSSFFLQRSKLKMSPCTTIFDTSSTPILVNRMSTIFEFSFFSTRRIHLEHFECKNSHFLRFFFFYVSCVDIYTKFLHWLDVITNGYCFWFRVALGLTSSPLCHTRFPTVDSPFQDTARRLLDVVQAPDFFRLHFSVQMEIESILFKIDWKKINHSMLVQQFLKMVSCHLTIFTVYPNHVTTIEFHMKILLFFGHSLSSIAPYFVYIRSCPCCCKCRRFASQHLMCTRESSIQWSSLAFFIVFLKLTSFDTWDPVIRTSISYSFSIKLHKDSVTCRSGVRVRCHPFWAFKWKWACGCETHPFVVFMPSNTTPFIIPLIQTPVVVHFIRAPFLMNQRRLSDINPVPSELIPDGPGYHLEENNYRCKSLINSETFSVSEKIQIYFLQNLLIPKTLSPHEIGKITDLLFMVLELSRSRSVAWRVHTKQSLFRLKITVGCRLCTYPSIRTKTCRHVGLHGPRGKHAGCEHVHPCWRLVWI